MTDQSAVSGDIKSVVGLWDLTTMRKTSMTVFPQYPEIDLNAIMALEFDPKNAHLFYSLQRSGHLTLCDTRIPSIIQLHTYCHHSRASSMRICRNSEGLVTSARGSEIKMWDLRHICRGNGVDQFLQIYNRHESEKLALGLDFLRDEKMIVTGSDSFYAHIYDVLTGEQVKTVKLAEGAVLSTVASTKDSCSFLSIYKSGHKLGLVSTEGPSIQHEFSSSEQIKDMYSKEAWEKAMIRNVDRVLAAARTVQSDIAVNYEQMMVVVRGSELPICKGLIHDLEQEYEAYMGACTPRLVRDLQAFYRKNAGGGETEGGIGGNRGKRRGVAGQSPRVAYERTTVGTRTQFRYN